MEMLPLGLLSTTRVSGGPMVTITIKIGHQILPLANHIFMIGVFHASSIFRCATLPPAP